MRSLGPTALERVAALGRASELRRCPRAETQRLDGETEDLGELKPTMVTVIQQHLMRQGTYGNRTFGEPRFTDFNDPCSELAILCSCNLCKILTSLVSISYRQIAALVLVCHLQGSPAVPESSVFPLCRLLSTITEPTEGGACEPPSAEEAAAPSLGAEESDPDKAEHGGIKKVCFKVSEEDQEDSGHDTMSFRDSYRLV